jgi:hypothetical protein
MKLHPVTSCSSTPTLSSTSLGPRLVPVAVITTRGWLSRIRPARDSALKPANTTECTAPMRVQASCGRKASHNSRLKP